MTRSDYGTSACGWHRFARVWALLFVRIIFAVWAVVMWIWSMVDLNGKYANNGYAPSPWWSWGVYLGNWAFFSLMLYYLTFAYFTIREICTGAPGKPNFCEKWLWINYEIAWSSMWSCAILFWTIVAADCSFNRNCAQISIPDYNIYAVSIATLLFEVLFNLVRWKWLHFIFTLIFLIVYFIIAAIWHTSTSVWPYAQQNDAVVGGGGAFGFYAVLILVFVGFHMCGFGCFFVMEKCYKHKRRTSEKDLMGDDPVQISDMCC